MKLSQKAVLMQLSLGMPGKARKDKDLTESVKSQHGMGENSGKWIKELYPDEALEPIEKLDNEIRSYFREVTLPFDAGIGILPAALIAECGDKMREFKGKRENLVETHFLARYSEWVAWARQAHNGTFDESLYPGADALRDKFKMALNPLPVPDVAHFESTVASLLGTDLESIEARVKSATDEAQKELYRRIMEPVAHMVKTLSKESPRIYNTLLGNIADICRLAPKLNLQGDPELDKLVAEVETLTRFSADTLRTDQATRDEARAKAEAVLSKLSGYNL